MQEKGRKRKQTKQWTGTPYDSDADIKSVDSDADTTPDSRGVYSGHVTKLKLEQKKLNREEKRRENGGGNRSKKRENVFSLFPCLI